MELINNRDKTLRDDLMNQITKDSKLSIAASCFSIYAFQELKDALEDIKQLRFIFTSPTFVKDNNQKEKREFYIPKLNRERNLYGSDFEIKLRNQLTQKAIARECADWIRDKVQIKSIDSNEQMGGFLNLKNDENTFTYIPFNEFTTTELGCERGNNIYQMINRLSSPESKEYLKIFDELWNDSAKFKDVKDIVVENIENI